MKKLIGIIAVLLLFASCGGNESYDIAFVKVAEEDQKLFKEEIGTNAELYLDTFSQNYKISQAVPITVSILPETENGPYVADVSWDIKMISATFEMVGIDLSEPIGKLNYEFNEKMGLFYGTTAYGDDNNFTYAYFPGDQRSFCRVIHGRSKILQQIKQLETNESFAGKTEEQQFVTFDLSCISNGSDQQIVTAFNCQLSNGKKLRVFFIADKKQ